MREPRAKQRFPPGGKAIYELLRRDYEPILLWLLPATRENEERLHGDGQPPDTLLLDSAFDPMVYFWPVEKQCVAWRCETEPEAEFKKRVLRALLRDGATWIILTWRTAPDPASLPDREADPPGSPFYDPRKPPTYSLRWENHGEPDVWKQYRGIATVDPVALPERGSGAD